MTTNTSRMFAISRSVLFVAAIGALFLATVGLTPADERITFKNGRTLVVKSVREEGNMLFVALVEGGEVGFPKSLIVEYSETASVPSGPINHNYAGRGKTFMEMAADTLVRRGVDSTPPTKLKGSMAKDANGRTATAGFSYMGTRDAAGSETGSAGHSVDIRAFAKQRKEKAKGTPTTTTLQPATDKD